MECRAFFAALAFVLAFQGQALAQQDRSALAREVLALTEVEGTLTDLFDVMSPIMATGAAQELGLSSVESARLGELLAEEFRNGMPEVMAQLSQTYASSLSEQELTDIVAFLRSPTGQALMRSQKQMEEDMQRVGQVFGMRAVLAAMTRLNEERARR